jgi:hypothetical protein
MMFKMGIHFENIQEFLFELIEHATIWIILSGCVESKSIKCKETDYEFNTDAAHCHLPVRY